MIYDKEKILLIGKEEQCVRLKSVLEYMAAREMALAIVTDNANKFYLTGRVFSGYILIGVDGEIRYFVIRPVNLTGDNVTHIRKPELMSEYVAAMASGAIGLELDSLSYTEAERLRAIAPERSLVNISGALREARSVKTVVEQSLIRRSGELQERVYSRIPSLFKRGMTDVDLQLMIELELRREGCLGQFRISGNSMELFMGNIIAGDNADAPSPYDFAMGGAGTHPSLPVGADGTVIKPGMAVMVDANGNFTGYMTDMTRTFVYGEISAEARLAHECSIFICQSLAQMGVPGASASEMYHKAVEIAREAGLEDYFMGHRQKAGFVGHGVGIEVNELPVIAPRSRSILQTGNVIALEPKFVIPGVGAVGVENTYIVGIGGMERVTNAPEQLIELK